MLLNEKLAGKQIILASQSPRRHELLTLMGIPFEVIVKPTNESFNPDLKREAVALHIAKNKAAAFAPFQDANTYIITADTIVCLDDDILNKPADNAEALMMLKKIQGRKHTVITAVTINTAGKQVAFFVSSDVYFKPLDEEQIAYYVNTYKPFDKAGAYGIQEWIGIVGLERIDGSYTNVMGLPTTQLYDALLRF
ncbi:MAG: septum formation protein Maf [Bacteroidia bacterium]|nr:septum formation protein Maf [Bacteroidia bacterium]